MLASSLGSASPVTSMGAPPPTTARKSLRWRRLLAVLAAMALLAGCAPDADPAATPEPPSDADASAPEPHEPPADAATPDDDPGGPAPGAPSASPAPVEVDDHVDRTALQTQLDALTATALEMLDDASLGVLAVDEDGRELVAHEAARPLLPASTLKLVTAAAVLVTLGPDATLTTTVETTAPVEDGVVDGDVRLVGTGDPLVATPAYGRWVYPLRPRTPLEDLADALVAVGVHRIDGDLVGRAPGFAGPLEGPGWRESYLDDFNGRRIAGLTVDAGVETLVTWPDEDEDNGDENEEDEDGPDPTAQPSASDPDAEAEQVRIEQADDPTVHAAGELTRLLEERGVEVTGEARGGDGDEASSLGTLARVESPPMEHVLRFMVQHSDNQIADTLSHLVGRVRTGEGSWERGERALQQVLDHLGVAQDDLRLADGSGLSRDARLTAAALVELDQAMADHRHAAVWESLMAVAGEPGTLQTRLRGTPAQGRLAAKTGSLRDVVSLSGRVRGDDGDQHRFAVVANDAIGTDRAVVRAYLDELVLHLAADVQDCDVQPAAGDDGPLGRPPVVVAC